MVATQADGGRAMLSKISCSRRAVLDRGAEFNLIRVQLLREGDCTR